MRYIAEIITENGPVESLVLDLWRGEHKYNVIVRDTDNRDFRNEYSGDEVIHYDFIGIGVVDGSNWVLVKHDWKQAKLMTYIKRVETIAHGEPDYTNADVYADVVGKLRVSQDIGTVESLVINTMGNNLFFGGSFNSVVTWREYYQTDFEAKSVWDTFAWYCINCGVNLMSYRKIQFFKKTNKTRIIIWLDQSPEAKRFFTKMYMDVCLNGLRE